jgi:hypothetical protein
MASDPRTPSRPGRPQCGAAGGTAKRARRNPARSTEGRAEWASD